MFRTLLVPTDFSSCADEALRLAEELARVHGSRLVLLHACEIGAGISPSTYVFPTGRREPVTVEAYVRAEALEKLEERAASLRARGIEAAVEVVLGEAGEAIVEIGDARADAIVMATHGRRGLSHVLLGSVAERVVRRSAVPVVTFRAKGGGELPERTPAERAVDDETVG